MAKSFKEIKQTLLMLKSLDRRIAQNFEKKTGISLTRYEMLNTIFERAQLSQIELQQTLKIDQGAITRHLKILEEKNFVVRNRNKQNNREVIVQITETGIATLEDCDLGKNEQIQKLIKKLIDNTNKKNH